MMNQAEAQRYHQSIQTKEDMMKELFNLLTIDGKI